MLISIITAFYHGNQFLSRLVNSIRNASDLLKGFCELELILVNDSPDDKVVLPQQKDLNPIQISVFNNPVNVGIQRARIAGLHESKGDWIVFLDQDDEVVSDGFSKLVRTCFKYDVVVGNLLFEQGEEQKIFYKNKTLMEYLLCYKNFLKFGNMIPSPGHCIIRRQAIPETWMNTPLQISGADDYYLWMLLLKEEKMFGVISDVVYIHHDNEGNNLSRNILKMYNSSREMAEYLKINHILSQREYIWMNRCLAFNYLSLRDSYTIKNILQYPDVFIAYCLYRYKRKRLGKRT